MKKTLSGGARLVASGKKPILLGVSAADKHTLEIAAATDGRPVSQFVVFHALAAAKKILKKQAEST